MALFEGISKLVLCVLKYTTVQKKNKIGAKNAISDRMNFVVNRCKMVASK